MLDRGDEIMSRTVSVPVADLLLDTQNARLGDEQPSQQAASRSLAEQQEHRLVVLARDIVEHGVDPTNLPAVLATGDQRRRYVVVEGNRRLLALKALETPSIVSGTLSAKDFRALQALSARYHQAPISELTCVLFDDQAELDHWVRLRHTGSNEGAGLVTWDSNEIDRYRARHGGGRGRTPGGQVLDFMERIDGPGSSRGILTSLTRLVNSPAVRAAVGLEKSQGELTTRFPSEEVAKGLRRILEDLRSGTVKVSDIYHEPQRRKYIESFTSADLPDPGTALGQPIPLADLRPGQTPTSSTKPATKPRAKARPKAAPRTSVIPSTCRLNPKMPRLNTIYNELLTLSVETYPNAAAVSLRVFVELSVDQYMDDHSLPRGEELYKRLKAVAAHLEAAGKIPADLRKVIDRVANTQKTVLAASTTTFNQYVHNAFAMPKPMELYAMWDELQPFMEKVSE